MSALMIGGVSALHADELLIGGQMPAFASMRSVDGKHWSSQDFASAKILIVAFTCNHCPYAVDYEERLVALHTYCKSVGKRVQLLVINSNYGRDESLERMKRRGQESGFKFAYVKDETQAVAKAFGAVYTPEFFVFNERSELVYKGAMDDATSAEDATVNYVRRAIESSLAGRTVKTSEVGARGCTIRFKRQRNSS